MKTSVVMTTYNGEKYICEQMLSILEQTKKPDEVIICDDCSEDRTAEIILHFIKTHGLDNWKLTVNEENKGWQRNFVEALGQASGSYIFFSDQDDIWYKDKIEIMVDYMENHPEIQCLSGKMKTIDENGKVFEGKNAFSPGSGSNALIEHKFSAKFNTITLLGCTMCISRKLADIVIRMNVKDYGHDAQCCRLGVLLDGAYTLERPVIYYRLHNHNTSGVVSDISFGSSNLQKRIHDIQKNIAWLERMVTISESEVFLNEEKKKVIKKTIEVQKVRSRFLEKKNILQFLKMFQYRDYYAGVSMYIGDFTYAFHINKLAGKVLWQIRNKKNKKK